MGDRVRWGEGNGNQEPLRDFLQKFLHILKSTGEHLQIGY